MPFPAPSSSLGRTMSRLLALFVALLPSAMSIADEPVDYHREVKPILQARCYACHGPLKQESALRVDTAAAMRGGGDSDAALVPGKSAASLLIERVTAADADERMPAEGEALTAAEIAILRRWIDQGAVAANDRPAPSPKDHWAFQPPMRPPIPSFKNHKAASHPIDAFLFAKLENAGLTALPPADRHTLLRRVYLDLIGLPPNRKQQQAFLDDPSASAFQTVVDELLASPHYGERWGRHWMDVWRYSDWSGYKNEIRDSQRHIWRWRDWIVESLNADKGYDRMLLDVLDADDLAPADRDALRATGFLARNWYKFNRNVWLDNTVEHTAKAFLGLTFNCARCHDHKYDPISHQNYYHLRAFFEPHEIRTDAIAGEPDLMKDGLPRAYDAKIDAPTYLFQRGNEKHPDKNNPLAPQLPAVFAAELQIEKIDLPPLAFYPALHEDMRRAALEAARAKEKSARESLEAARQSDDGPDKQAAVGLAELKLAAATAELASLAARTDAELAKYGLAIDATTAESPVKSLALGAANAQRAAAVGNAELSVFQAEQALAKLRASDKPDEKKTKDAIAKAEKSLADARKRLDAAREAQKKTDSKYEPLGPQLPKVSSGRRAALARWIIDRDNPLTARVAVNHIWTRHFGRPLVENVFDFGMQSPQPAHVELLDWLAVELMENGWSMKHLHRLIVTSAAYQRTSSAAGASAACSQVDPDNRLLWRMNTRRLEAEAVRDCVLHVAGNLDTKRGGPDIDYQQGLTNRRRSIYFRHAYEKQMKFLELFDAASVSECYRRSQSIIPQQALALGNSTLVQEQSRLLASNIAAEFGEKPSAPDAFVEAAFRTILARRADDDEVAACRDFLDRQTKLLSDQSKLTTFGGGAAAAVKPANDPRQRARENLVQVLMNHTDFVTIR